ncbi:MAG: ABC transporter permease subunit [bacterium]|nr:MAG: ABC transporter permease subunit [bacterium]
MIWTITKKEILEQFISVRFIILTIICVMLLPMSLFVSYRGYKNQVADYNRSVRLSQENIENLNLSQVFTGDFSIKGYRPPSPLNVFASGLSESMPKSLEAKKSGLTLVKGGDKSDSILTITGKIDFTFILMIVFSLLAILFTFDAVCGEKEKGILRAALSNSIPRDKYILGKYFGTMFTLLLPLIVSILIGLILLVLLGYQLFTIEIFTRIFLILINSIIFISIFSCIGLLISTRVNNSKTSIIILVSVWIILMFVIPKGSDIVARAFIPVDSDEVIELQKLLVQQNLQLEKGKRIAEMEKDLPQIALDMNQEEKERVYQKRNEMLNGVRNEYAQKINNETRKIDEQHELEKAWQNSVALTLARISPATSFNKITTDLAWTGEQTRKNFEKAAKVYLTVLNQSLFNFIFRDISPSGGISMGITEPINFKELPTFQFERSLLPETFKAVVLDIGLMLFFSIFSFVLVYVSFLKYDIR